MYGRPLRVQTGQQGFVPSKFHPMGAILMPAPTIVAPAPVAPAVVRRDSAYVFPSAAPVLVTETGMSSDTKVVLGIGAVLALLLVGAALS